MKKYLITSPEIYTDKCKNFKKILKKQVEKHLPDFILFRDKVHQNYDELAKCFVDTCKELNHGMKCLIHQDVDLAHILEVDGVHLTSKQFSQIQRAKKFGLYVIVSTHTHDEVLEAQNLGADAVTYSPIFYSPNKGIPKGIEDLQALLELCDVKVFALGGIVSDMELKALESTQVYGFSSIRYFQ